MSKTEAHSLLNAAIAGMPVTPADILRALKVTGDFDPFVHTPKELEQPYTYSQYLDQKVPA